MGIFLGIDGGASKTSCLIGNEESVLGRGTAAGSSVIRIGEARSGEAIAAGIREACADARVTPLQIERTCIGVTGAARPQIQEIIRRILAEIVCGEIEVAGDHIIAREAAFGSGPGVIVIAGTGSIAYGENGAGKTARAGGWGFAISDEGSGHWIGKTAISAVMRARDEDESGKGSSRLLAGILQFWEMKSVDELVIAANGSPARDFAGLFPVVLAASDGGDAVAMDVLRRAGAELAGLAEIVSIRLFSRSGDVPVAMCGGVFANSAAVREAFAATLRSRSAAVVIQADVVQSVYGALARARMGGRI